MQVLAAVYLLLLNTSPTDAQICVPEKVGSATTLQCCTLSSGQQCCAQSLAGDGTIAGCGCTP
ncbi:hypothetical protein [Defluviimonas sp. SAOS-178_SWC]|uniref:hypothetical protein n=1 Tax=Defluviimonas sp. SAOS-178_SWC TaxID=3121287 RepID=UPI0032220C28